jgi:dihydrofolate synthase/folylpolyglutamate synthase
MKTLQEVEAYLATLIPRHKSFGDRLSHVVSILEQLGSPQNSIPAIHIAGTSGKGSTAYYTAAILHEAGYSVGLTVSPHVSKVSERTQVNGTTLPDDEYCMYVTEFMRCIETLDESVTYIEFLTCFSFWLFAKLKLDYIVIEVGVGGRLDSTNVITRDNTVHVITDIGFDHTEILGNTLDAIAREKTGIIQDGDIICMHPQGKLVMSSVEQAVNLHRAKLVLSANTPRIEGEPMGYQHRNWLLAKQAVQERLTLDTSPTLDLEIFQRAAEYTIPGRFEVFKSDTEQIILDAAHNPQKMKAYVSTLRQTYPAEHIIALISLGKNKTSTAKDTLSVLERAVDEVIVTEFTIEEDDSHGALGTMKVSHLLNSEDVKTITSATDAMLYARNKARETNGVVVVTGSFYLVSNLRGELMREFAK